MSCAKKSKRSRQSNPSPAKKSKSKSGAASSRKTQLGTLDNFFKKQS